MPPATQQYITTPDNTGKTASPTHTCVTLQPLITRMLDESFPLETLHVFTVGAELISTRMSQKGLKVKHFTFAF